MIRIALAFAYNIHYCRGVLQGIRHYVAQKQPQWSLIFLGPEAKAVKGIKPAGIIAYIYEEAIAESFIRLRKPLVNICGVVPNLNTPQVDVDNTQVGQLAAEHLRQRGCRHFAYVGHSLYAFSLDREAGFRNGVAETGGDAIFSFRERPLPFTPIGNPLSLNTLPFRRWLSSLPKPVGVFAGSVWLGMQLCEICRDRKLRVPEDVSLVVAANDDLLCELAQPPLSAVVSPVEQIGYTAAKLLDLLLAGEEVPNKPLLFPPLGVVTRRSSDFLAIEDPHVAAAVRFINKCSKEPMQVHDVAHAVGVSRRSLERKFQKFLQRTVGEEIRRVHVEIAKKLLQDTDLSIAEVAAHSGFGSASQLSVVFHQAVGLTPTAYRRSYSQPPGYL